MYISVYVIVCVYLLMISHHVSPSKAAAIAAIKSVSREKGSSRPPMPGSMARNELTPKRPESHGFLGPPNDSELALVHLVDRFYGGYQ